MDALARVSVFDRLGAWWERHHPLALAGVMAASYGVYGYDLMQHAISSGWQVGNLYSSAFDVSSVFTAFLFTFYTFVVTTESGFIGRMKKTDVYGLLKSYSSVALVLGALLIAASIPMMIIEPKPVNVSGWHYVVAVWIGLAVWTAAAFLRAARLFVEFIRLHG